MKHPEIKDIFIFLCFFIFFIGLYAGKALNKNRGCLIVNSALKYYIQLLRGGNIWWLKVVI